MTSSPRPWQSEVYGHDMPQRAMHFGLGLLLGIIASFAISLNLILAVVAVVVVILIGLRMPRFATLAGGLIGVGGTWFVLTLTTTMRVCAETPQEYCEGGYVPFLAIAAGLVLAGAAFAAWTVVVGARRARSS